MKTHFKVERDCRVSGLRDISPLLIFFEGEVASVAVSWC